ncbi:hypothetical protein HDU88_006517 [Geranomyces variabilis]|nr:hypothetical protein HDU88_006517 [Geranomyces variabilis]
MSQHQSAAQLGVEAYLNCAKDTLWQAFLDFVRRELDALPADREDRTDEQERKWDLFHDMRSSAHVFSEVVTEKKKQTEEKQKQEHKQAEHLLTLHTLRINAKTARVIVDDVFSRKRAASSDGSPLKMRGPKADAKPPLAKRGKSRKASAHQHASNTDDRAKERNLRPTYSFSARYAAKYADLTASPVLPIAQLGRHWIAKTEWALFNTDTIDSMGVALIGQSVQALNPVSCNAELVSAILAESIIHKPMIIALQKNMEDGKILPLGTANAGYIDALTMSSAMSTLVTYSPTSARGQGSKPSEHHVKNELWVDIFTKSVKLAAGPFVSQWKMWHLFPGNAGKGSLRSDFSALAVDAQGKSFPFLIVESEVNGIKAHKDYLVAALEAVLELNTIVVQMCESEADLARLSIFVGLVADTSISFRQIQAAIDVDGVVFYTDTDCGRTYALGMKSAE